MYNITSNEIRVEIQDKILLQKELKILKDAFKCWDWENFGKLFVTIHYKQFMPVILFQVHKMTSEGTFYRPANFYLIHEIEQFIEDKKYMSENCYDLRMFTVHDRIKMINQDIKNTVPYYDLSSKLSVIEEIIKLEIIIKTEKRGGDIITQLYNELDFLKIILETIYSENKCYNYGRLIHYGSGYGTPYFL